MRILKTKSQPKPARFVVKIPPELAQKIADLNAKVDAAGLFVDWSEPVAAALERHALAVETDLAVAAKVA